MKLKNEALQKLYDKLASDTLAFNASIEEQLIIDEIFKKCDEELSDLITFAQIKDLQDRNDILERSNEVLLGSNLDLATKKRKLQKDLDDAKKQLKYFTQSRDDWRSRAKHAEDEVEGLKKKLDFHQKVDDLKSRLNSVYGVCGAGYDTGQTDLWNKLQNVNDAKPWDIASFYPDVSCMDDILSWDLEDFLDAYKSWQEEKEKKRLDHMRDYLKRFCKGRLCCNCPLYTDEFMCGRVKPFSGISDEELERYYEKARDCGKRPWHGDATAEKIKFKPCSCTFEGTMNVEINRDLLNKICGIDSDD